MAVALTVLAVTCSPAAASGSTIFFPFDHVDSPQSVTDTAGVTTVVWSEAIAAETYVVMGRRVGADGAPLGAPVQLSPSSGANPVGVAVDASGNAIVLWSQTSTLVSAPTSTLVGVRWTAAGSVGAPRTLDTSFAYGSGARVVVSSNGAAPTATMVWLDVDPSSDYSIHGQQWPLSSDSPANSAQELSAGGEPVSEYTVAAAASGSEATIAWTDASPFYATSETARAIRWPIGGAPGTEATVSSANDVFGGVMAVGADAAGDSVIAWRGENPTTAVHAARWPQAASAPAAQQTVSGAGDTGVGNVSISVATGGAGTIVWRATGTSNASSPYVADAVHRPGSSVRSTR